MLQFRGIQDLQKEGEMRGQGTVMALLSQALLPGELMVPELPGLGLKYPASP